MGSSRKRVGRTGRAGSAAAVSALETVKRRKATQRGLALSPAERAARVKRIDHMYEEEGLTLDEIGATLGISRERVRQLRTSNDKSAETRKQRTDMMLAFGVFWEAIREPATLSLAEAKRRACEAAGITVSTMNKLVATLPKHEHAAVMRLLNARRQWETIRAMQLLGAEVGRTPTATDIVNEGGRFGLYLTTISKRLGTLREAQRRAGFVPNTPRGAHLGR